MLPPIGIAGIIANGSVIPAANAVIMKQNNPDIYDNFLTPKRGGRLSRPPLFGVCFHMKNFIYPS